MNGRHIPPRAPVVDRTTYILEACGGRTVLHLGCSDWPLTEEKIAHDALLHDKLGHVAAGLTGLDAIEDGIETLRRHGYEDCHVDDVEDLRSPALSQRTFEVIVAGEIIEHLANPGLFLLGIQRLMTPDSRLIVTTPNAYCAFRFLRYLLGKEMVHDDHFFYFSPRVLTALAERCGLSVVDFKYYGIGNEIRAITPMVFRTVDRLSTWFAPRTSDGLIVSLRVIS